MVPSRSRSRRYVGYQSGPEGSARTPTRPRARVGLVLGPFCIRVICQLHEFIWYWPATWAQNLPLVGHAALLYAVESHGSDQNTSPCTGMRILFAWHSRCGQINFSKNLFAKSLHCEQGISSTPAGICNSCV